MFSFCTFANVLLFSPSCEAVASSSFSFRDGQGGGGALPSEQYSPNRQTHLSSRSGQTGKDGPLFSDRGREEREERRERERRERAAKIPQWVRTKGGLFLLTHSPLSLSLTPRRRERLHLAKVASDGWLLVGGPPSFVLKAERDGFGRAGALLALELLKQLLNQGRSRSSADGRAI